MLKSLHVSNFKAFGDEAQEIPLRPITLIFGPNSGGKSSAIHSLLLAHHLAETGEVDVHRTKLGGDAVDLGGFQRYVYRRTPENRVRLELNFEVSEVPANILRQWAERELDAEPIYVLDPESYPTEKLFIEPLQAPLRGATEDSEISLNLEIGQRLREKRQSRRKATPGTEELEVPTGELEPIEAPDLLGAEIEIEGSQLLRLHRSAVSHEPLDGQYSVQQFNVEHSLIKRLIKHRYKGELEDRLLSSETIAPPDVEQEIWKAANDARRLREIGTQGIFPEVKFDFSFAAHDPDAKWSYYPGYDFDNWETRFSWTSPDETIDIRSDLRFFFLKLIQHYTERVVMLARHALERLQYLGPIRSYPARHPQNNEKKDADWYAGGGYAWELLREDAEVRQKVNRWLGSADDDEKRLQTPYEIKPRRFLTDEVIEQKLPERVASSMIQVLANVLGEQIDLGFGGIDELSRLIRESSESLFQDIDQAVPELQQIVSSSVDTEELVQAWVRQMTEQSDGIQDITLVDQRTRTPVSHRDVGIGISQLLPVLTYAYAYEDKVIALEQPELHLHPAVQAELGDLFIGTALGEQDNQFIIETHSEHLILRLLRRIRETTSGELDDERLSLTPDDVAVLYAEPTRSGTTIHHLRVTPDGDFANRWPDGFFNERSKELF